MELAQIKKGALKSPIAFIFIVVFELTSADITVYEVFTNLQAGLSNPGYLVAIIIISLMVFIFLYGVGAEAFEFLLKLEQQKKE